MAASSKPAQIEAPSAMAGKTRFRKQGDAGGRLPSRTGNVPNMDSAARPPTQPVIAALAGGMPMRAGGADRGDGRPQRLAGGADLGGECRAQLGLR